MALAANISGQPVMSPSAFKNSAIVLTETQFGHAWIARLVLTTPLLGFVVLRSWDNTGNTRRKWFPIFLAICLMGSLAWSGHAGGTPGLTGDIHVAGDVLHLIAAGAWLGGLLPLVLLLVLARKKADPSLAIAARTATLRFSTLGLFSVGTLLATGLVNTWMLADSLAGLVGTAYGRLLLVKIVLFIAMVGVAAFNRLRLTPALPQASSIHRLARNAISEIGLGLLILAIVSVLGVLPPAAHIGMQMH